MKSTSLLLILGSICMLGCSSDAPGLTKQEQADFKGKPMPSDAREKMNESIAKWQKDQASKNAGNAPSKPGG